MIKTTTAKTILLNINKLIAIDKDILWILINKIWAIFKGPISIFFIITYLSSEEQGLWYTFISLGALSMFAELGFTMIITQFVSHEFAHLKEENGILVGERVFLERIISLIKFSIKFYLIIIPTAIIILALVGFIYFGFTLNITFSAWIVFSFVGGLSLFTSLLQAIYQGLDKVKSIQINILIGSIFMSSFNWILLYLRFSIWALVWGNLLGLIIMSILLYYIAPSFWNQIRTLELRNKFNWFKEIINLQWKYAISWASGFFIFYLLIPATYKYIGKIEAGQFGVTQSIVSSVSGLSAGWVVSKLPKFNILVAKNEMKELDNLFMNSSIRALIIQLIFSLLFLIILFFIKKYTPYENRFLDIYLTSMILLSQIAQSIINFTAIYLRSHKKEPFVWLSLLNAILMTGLIFFVLSKYGLTMLFISINIMLWFIILPLAIIIYKKHKNRYVHEKTYIH